MTPMTHDEAQLVIREWADVLADDNYEIWVGFDSDGPVVLIKAERQLNVLQWLL